METESKLEGSGMRNVFKGLTLEKVLMKPLSIKWSAELGVFTILIVLCVALSIMSPSFFTTSNILNIFRQVSANGLIALGQLLVIISGGIDLSVGAIIAFTSIISAKLMLTGMSAALAIPLTLCVGMLVGLLNGVLISKGRIAPFIATLSTMTIFRGFTYIMTQGIPVYGFSDNLFKYIGLGYIGQIPFPVIVTLIGFVVVGVFLKKTRTGRRIYAVGSNSEAAKMCGISITKIQMLVYALSGLLATIGGIIISSKLNAGVPQTGYGAELDAIAAVVIGGASLVGGVGFVYGTGIGTLIVGVVQNGLNLLNVYSYWQSVIVGIVILVAVLSGQINIKSNRKKRTKRG